MITMKTSLPLLSTDRKCGPCSACCFSKGVLEIDKVGGVYCQHLDSVGCGIYSDRPDSCKSYQCYWLQGNLPEPLRPDICGFVLDLDRETTTLERFYCAGESYPGAFKDEKVIWRLKKLCKLLNEPIILGGHSMMVPMTLKWKAKVLKTFGKDLTVTWVQV